MRRDVWLGSVPGVRQQERRGNLRATGPDAAALQRLRVVAVTGSVWRGSTLTDRGRVREEHDDGGDGADGSERSGGEDAAADGASERRSGGRDPGDSGHRSKGTSRSRCEDGGNPGSRGTSAADSQPDGSERSETDDSGEREQAALDRFD